MISSNKYASSIYYVQKNPIGLHSLVQNVFESKELNKDSFLKTCLFTAQIDLMSTFMVSRRLFTSLNTNDNFEISLDATSFYLFLRIYYDSLASAIHFLSKRVFPGNSRKHIPINSFNKQLTWLAKSDIDIWHILYSGYKEFGYEEEFLHIRDTRNQIKMRPLMKNSRRFALDKMIAVPNKKILRNAIGKALFKTISLTDYIGDYFYSHIPELLSTSRVNYNAEGYPVGYLHPGERAIYEWFITDRKQLNMENFKNGKWLVEIQ